MLSIHSILFNFLSIRSVRIYKLWKERFHNKLVVIILIIYLYNGQVRMFGFFLLCLLRVYFLKFE